MKYSDLTIGDPVIVKNDKKQKGLAYDPNPLVIVDKRGSMISAKRGCQIVTRNSSFFKKSPLHPGAVPDEDEEEEEMNEDHTSKPPDDLPVGDITTPPMAPVSVSVRPQRDRKMPKELCLEIDWLCLSIETMFVLFYQTVMLHIIQSVRC